MINTFESINWLPTEEEISIFLESCETFSSDFSHIYDHIVNPSSLEKQNVDEDIAKFKNGEYDDFYNWVQNFLDNFSLYSRHCKGNTTCEQIKIQFNLLIEGSSEQNTISPFTLELSDDGTYKIQPKNNN